jgi:hypothetical protein
MAWRSYKDMMGQTISLVVGLVAQRRQTQHKLGPKSFCQLCKRSNLNTSSHPQTWPFMPRPLSPTNIVILDQEPNSFRKRIASDSNAVSVPKLTPIQPCNQEKEIKLYFCLGIQIC